MRNDPRMLLVALLAGSSGAASAFEITPVGRLHLDYGHYDWDVTPFDDRSLVRRAQFGLEAKFNDDWSAKAVYDFAGGGSDFFDGDRFDLMAGVGEG